MQYNASMKLPKSLTTVTSLSKALAIILFITLPFLGFYLGLTYQQSSSVPNGPIACTQEAKMCPDGTSVGRVGPNCEFAPCPVLKASPTQSAGENCCSIDKLGQGYLCIKTCGPPVERVGDQTIRQKCFSPDELKNLSTEEVQQRRILKCPICLSSNTLISTPIGERRVTEIKIGQLVWTVDKRGHKIASAVIMTGRTLVPSTHRMVHLVLADGRELWVSPGHPTTDHRTVDQLWQGEEYSGSRIITTELVPYWDDKTYDILPAGETGYYYANGILIGSTLK